MYEWMSYIFWYTTSMMMKSSHKGVLLVIFLALLLVGGLFFYLNTSGQKQHSFSKPSPTPDNNQTQRITPSSNITGVKTLQIKIYLVALEDQGKSGEKIGCGDSLVAVTQEVPQTKAILKESLTKLFAIKDQYYGQSGLYNSLYNSALKLDNVAIVDGVATITLSGQLSLGGVCDNPRALGQIEATAKQFETVKSVKIFLNGKPFSETLSGK